MRALAGNLFILLFISIFSLLFMETTRELSSARSLHDVLDESVELEDVSLSQNSFVLDKDGNTVSDVFSAENRINLSYESIPDKVRHAFLAAEDQSFFDHPGFDLTGIGRAFLINMQNASIEQGGSTITQQLARNLYLNHTQSYERKLTELLYSYHLEQKLEKEDILEMYINSVYFANGVYGIEAAANYYFDLNADELSLGQVAFLASIPNNPSHYNPLNNPDLTELRQEWILSKMLETGYIEEAHYTSALEEEITLHAFEKKDTFPDYVTYVFAELRELISVEEGYDRRIRAAANNDERSALMTQLYNRTDEVLRSGVIIETALDPDIQTHAVNTINSKLSGSDVQAAMSVIDHNKAEITAVTGGVNYEKAQLHRAFQTYRQPGSAIKPLLVYAPLLEETNMNALSVIDAGPVKRGSYEPRNFGGAVYGHVTIDEAFKHSYNTAAVRILDMIGIDESFSYLDIFGFRRVTEADKVLPAALGGFSEGMTVNELTQAYTAFATRGIYRTPKAIRSVKDRDGNVLYEWKEGNAEIWSQGTVEKMRGLLSNVVSEGTGRGARFSTGGYIGGKTGTTNNFHDLWFIGSTDHYTAGIWIGKDNPAPLLNENKHSMHTNIWRDVMRGID